MGGSKQLKVNSNYEIQLKNERNFFFPNWDLNCSPLELNASVLPMSYVDPYKLLINSVLVIAT